MNSHSLPKQQLILHWLVSICVIGLLAVGLYMTNTKSFNLYGIHKSVGVLVFVIIIWRVIVRMRAGWPENISEGKAWEHQLARLIHWVLILGTLMMPISGILDSIGGGRGLYVFGLELVSSNIDAVSGKVVVVNQSLSDMAETVHKVVGKVLLGAIVLHLLGALKHHFVDKDRTLKRMLGK